MPVRAAVARQVENAPDLALTGTIAARIQSNVAFRVAGKVTARLVEVGQHVGPNDVLARLDPTEQRADVSSATAALAAAQATLQQAQQTFDRQKQLIASGFTTRASYDQAETTLNANTAQVAVAQAALNTAKEQSSYTELKTGQSGVIVSRTLEAGQVVQAGQTVFVLAQDGPRDAVFAIPEALLTAPPSDNTTDVVLQSDPKVATTGTVREIAPLVDPATGTVTVKIGLIETPPQMALGTAVVGHARWDRHETALLPWSALFERDGKPALWVIDDQNRVALRPIEVGTYRTGAFTVAHGLAAGERVVVDGVQLLFPGQKVLVVEGNAP
ncbi:efflux RND transporter periplasmic adaptor subunit [Lichenihabitans sp. Uapishka_5]|uniref:efflux RND transporter periplasmic adaptor subunit n=1 Tax=Lichenihabitans sp. Uapishka_5 TaxID=3037302 RepID=UPI0029E7FD22|nr:efflux RND transporter periplasmic adaptor subunit [Lichenihabitans sp. Uapishka_5]MDX7949582.1 efflux RND transporter periplasmic adaptor subunit [Lichenihabitans sp. Uapishka_5]